MENRKFGSEWSTRCTTQTSLLEIIPNQVDPVACAMVKDFLTISMVGVGALQVQIAKLDFGTKVYMNKLLWNHEKSSISSTWCEIKDGRSVWVWGHGHTLLIFQFRDFLKFSFLSFVDLLSHSPKSACLLAKWLF